MFDAILLDALDTLLYSSSKPDKSFVADCMGFDSVAFFPVSNSVKDLNAFAAVAIFSRKTLIDFIIGVKRLINPCPILALID